MTKDRPILHIQGHELRADAKDPQGPVGNMSLVPMQMEDDGAYLHGAVAIGLVGNHRFLFYAEAIEVVDGPEGWDIAANPKWESRLDVYCAEYDQSFGTLTHDNRRYVVFITPQGA